MSNFKDRNEFPDEFSNLIKNKIEDYRVPVDTECWDEIELRLQPKAYAKTGSKKTLWWIGGAAATIAIIIFALTFRPVEKDGSDVQTISSVDTLKTSFPKEEIKEGKEENKQKIEEEKEKTEPANIIYTSPDKPAYVADNRKDRNKEDDINKDIKEIINTIDTVSLTGTIPGNNLAENTPEVDADKKEPETKQETKPDADKTTKKNDIDRNISKDTRILIPEKAKSSGNWLLAASVSSGGNSSIGNPVGKNPMFANDLSSEWFKEPMYLKNDQIPQDEFNDIDYSMPLSFGLSVRKDITSLIGVETGLVYTYLSTSMKKGGTPHYQAKQEIHYLGIPLNLIVNLWNDARWNIYLSGGGMVEKGLKGIYTQDLYLNSKKTLDTKDKGSVHGVQWSLNASVGVSYSFYEGLGIYAEPRVSYYFDNKQPISIRTEKSTVFGLGAGLRYKF